MPIVVNEQFDIGRNRYLTEIPRDLELDVTLISEFNRDEYDYATILQRQQSYDITLSAPLPVVENPNAFDGDYAWVYEWNGCQQLFVYLDNRWMIVNRIMIPSMQVGSMGLNIYNQSHVNLLSYFKFKNMTELQTYRNEFITTGLVNGSCIYQYAEHTNNEMVTIGNTNHLSIESIHHTYEPRIQSIYDVDMYTPTEEEINYPEIYTRRHDFRCKSKSPIVVGSLANRFKLMIHKELDNMSF